MLGSASARADETAPPPRLAHDLRLDIPVTVVATGAAIGLGAASSSLTTTCRWCTTNGLDDALRRALRRDDPGPAGVVSDVVAVASPFANVGFLTLAAYDEGHVEGAPLDTLLVGEATAIAMTVASVTNVAFARASPGRAGGDGNTSFVSSQVTFAAALAASAGTIAHARGYRLEPLVWAVGVPLALATSYLEIAADRAHSTDVFGGLALGALVGAGVPLLFRGPVSERVMVSASPLPGGHMLTLTFRSPL